jgi:acyl-CoA thioester hydrolase
MPDSKRLPLSLYAGIVASEWIDYNDHMNDAYYLIPFSRATDAWMDAFGLDAEYRHKTACTIYTAESHLVYLRELKSGAPYDVTGVLMGFDEKRIHLFMAMHHTTENYLAATCEWMLLHVDRTTGRSASLPPVVSSRLGAMFLEHSSLSEPSQAGRWIHMTQEAPSSIL